MHCRAHSCFRTLVVLALVLLSTAVSIAGVSEDENKLLSQISIAGITSTVERLCSPEFGGRRAGSPQQAAVIGYITSHFKKAGLVPVDGLEGYLQPLTMRYSLVRSKSEIKATLSYSVPGIGHPVSRIRSFPYPTYNGNGGLKLKSQVVFVGYGIDDPASGYSDYRGLDVHGKVVLWLPGRPNGLSCSATVAHKTAMAYQRGAVACITYRTDDQADEWGTNVGLAGSFADFPCLAVSAAVADELLSASGLLVAQLVAQPYDELPVGARGADVSLSVTPVCDSSRRTYNVLGIIPGTDPEVADEVVILGGHYDHLGDTAQGTIYPGADDDASGASVVMEVADAFLRSGLPPRRSIVFVEWTGEEAGLVGSNFFASNPPFPLEKIRSAIQLDMVGAGSPRAFVAGGAMSHVEHAECLESSAFDLGIELLTNTRVGASDHLALLRKKVPSTLIYAAGEHPNYHTVRDVPSALNQAVLKDAARLAALAIWRAANAGETNVEAGEGEQ